MRDARALEGVMKLEVAGRRHVTGNAALNGVLNQVPRGS
jgi:hypothetical protein